MKGRRRLLQWVFMLLGLTLVAACGGGGGGQGIPQASKVTIKGAISFPASTDLVLSGARRAARLSSDNSITVEAYTLDGVLVPSASVHPDYDDATRIYSYTLPNLPPNTDYIIKVTRGTQVLKKLIGKDDTTGGTLQGQTVDAVSSAAIIVASSKVSSSTARVSLGESLPAGKTVSDLSAAINSSVKPALLEEIVRAAIGSSKISVTTDTANFVNVFNVVVTAVVENKNYAAVFAGKETLSHGVPIFRVSGGMVTPPSNDSSTWSVPQPEELTQLATTSATAYTAPIGSAKTYTDLAERYLAVQDIANASLNYEKALTIDPSDKNANFGGAITSGLMLIEDQDVKSVVAKWEGVLPTVSQLVQATSPVKVPFGNLTSQYIKPTVAKTAAKEVVKASSAQDVVAAFRALQAKLPKQKAGYRSVAKELSMVPTTPPTVSEMQSVIDNVIIPRIDKILSRLAKIEGSGYSFKVTAAMQGNPQYGSDVLINDGEFYTLDAALHLFLVPLEIATAYNFDLPSNYSYDTISQDPLAMINSPSVFTLKANGAAKMNAALGYARDAAEKATKAYSALKSRAAGVGAFDITNWSATERADFLNGLDKIKTALAGPTTIVVGDKAVTIDATKFFTNPLTRANLPALNYDVPRDATLSAKYGKPVAAEKQYTYPGITFIFTDLINCSIVAKSDLPDYSLNGILPGNSAASNVAGFNGIIPVLDGKVRNITNNWSSWTTGYSVYGTYLYSLGMEYNSVQQSPVIFIQKLDVSTGETTKVSDLTVPTWPRDLALIDGEFYVTTMTYQYNSSTRSYDYLHGLYHVTQGATSWTLDSTPAVQLQLSNYSYVSAITTYGSDIYFVASDFDQLTWTSSSSFYKITGIGTTSPTVTKLFTDRDQHHKLAVTADAIYTDSPDFDVVKWTRDGSSVVAAYVMAADTGWNALVGGNFYGISDTKIIKYAGKP